MDPNHNIGAPLNKLGLHQSSFNFPRVFSQRLYKVSSTKISCLTELDSLKPHGESKAPRLGGVDSTAIESRTGEPFKLRVVQMKPCRIHKHRHVIQSFFFEPMNTLVYLHINFKFGMLGYSIHTDENRTLLNDGLILLVYHANFYFYGFNFTKLHKAS